MFVWPSQRIRGSNVQGLQDAFSRLFDRHAAAWRFQLLSLGHPDAGTQRDRFDGNRDQSARSAAPARPDA